MAKIQDRKSNFYGQRQAVKDESGALQHLESAGDVLIKNLVKKQTQTCITLQEQLQVVQNFEKGFELNPDNQKGLTSLNSFKSGLPEEKDKHGSSRREVKTQNVAELMKITGLGRHELELSLCEKPNSKVSHLYKFAISNTKYEEKHESLELKLAKHPINHLKEIEEEHFGHLKVQSPKKKVQADFSGEKETKVVMNKKKIKKKRKRKKKEKPCHCLESQKFTSTESTKLNNAEPSFSRPSLWDVKDMKKWSESKIKECKPQKFYTIKDGKIEEVKKVVE